MDQDDFDTTLGDIFDAYKEKQDVWEKAKTREDKERQDFLALFRDKVQNVIKPIFERAEQEALAAAIDIKIKSNLNHTNDANLEAHTMIGDRVCCFKLSFSADYKSKRVIIERGDWGKGSSDPLSLEQISKPLVEKEIINFLQKVTNTKPRALGSK